MDFHIHHHRDPKEADDAAKIIARLTVLVHGVAALATVTNARFDQLEGRMTETTETLDEVKQEIADIKALADTAVQQLTDQRTAVIEQTQTIATLRDQLANLQVNGDPTKLHEILGALDVVKDELGAAVNPPDGSVAKPPSAATQNQPKPDPDASTTPVDTGPGA